MATIRILLGIVCLVAAYSSSLYSSNFLSAPGTGNRALEVGVSTETKLLNIARREIGVREKTGNNDGKRVEAYLACVHLKKGNPWCAAFVSWVFGQAGFAQPRTAWSPALFPLARQLTAPKAGALFGVYFPALKRIAHCGLVEKPEHHWIITIEGNTNMAGSRDGDGVYRKRRPLKTLKYFAGWIKQKGGTDGY